MAITLLAMVVSSVSWMAVRSREKKALLVEHVRSERDAAETAAAAVAALLDGFRSDLDRLSRIPSVRYLDRPERLRRSLRSFEQRTVIDSLALIRVDSTGAVLFQHPDGGAPEEVLEALRASGELERMGRARQTLIAPASETYPPRLIALSDVIWPTGSEPIGAIIAVFPASALVRPLGGLIRPSERSVLLYLDGRPLFEAWGPTDAAEQAAPSGNRAAGEAGEELVARALVPIDAAPSLVLELRSEEAVALAPLEDSRGRLIVGLVLLNALIGIAGGLFLVHELRLGGRLDESATHRRQLEAQLRQAQKMEGLGTLAGGIAHDFNNILTAIQVHAELLLERVGDDPADRAEVEGVLRSADRASALTRQLLTFSRKQVVRPRQLDLGQTIAEMETMLRRLIGEHIELVCHAPLGLGYLQADPGQMEQMIFNLVVNAKESMPAGGRIVIELQTFDLERSEYREGVVLPEGEYLCLSITDSGRGMDDRVREQIFEPFFTTKPHGTGLGLSTVYGIVRQAGGDIGVRSTPAEGTVFTVWLPRSHGSGGQPDAGRSEEPTDVEERPRTVLLVEDDDAVRHVARRTLEKAGYVVVEESDPLEALDFVLEGGHRIDLLLTDVVMPGMSGHELAERVAEVHPGIPTICMSGYTQDEVMLEGIATGSLEFLAKPFSTTDLLRKVERALTPGGHQPAEGSVRDVTSD